MLIFTPKKNNIILLDNVREKKKDIISLIKNSIPEYYEKKKYTYYVSRDKIVIVTFDDSLPLLDDKDKRVPIYNLCRLLLENTEENTYSIFCFKEYKLSVIFKDEILIGYETDLGDLEIYVKGKKKELVANSNSNILVYSDVDFDTLEIKEIIDFNRKEVLTKLEKNDILIKKSPITKFLSKIDVKFSLTEFLVKASGFITLLVMLFYFINSNKELNVNIKEMMKMKQEIKENTVLFKELTSKVDLIKINTEKNNTLNEKDKQDIINAINRISDKFKDIKINTPMNVNPMNTNQNVGVNPNVKMTSQEKQTRETFSREIDGYGFKVKVQSDSLLILRIGNIEYRLNRLVPMKIRNFQAIYSPKTNTVVFMNVDGLKIGYDIINYQLYFQI